MSQKQNLLVFAIFVSLLGVLGLLMWTGEPEGPGADSLAGAEGGAMETEGTALPEDAGTDLGEESRLAEGDAAGRSQIETPLAEADANSILLSGRLLHENRQPAADVALSFRPHAHLEIDDLEDISSLRDFSPEEMERRMDEQAVKAETSLDGRFAFRIPIDQKGNVLLAEDSNRLFADEEQRYHPIAGFTKDVDLGDLILMPGASLAGKVTDAQGQGIEGVTISMSGVNSPRLCPYDKGAGTRQG
ncbi:MAG: hypothetical protein ACYTG5_18115 [Planctomycetota bacterium]|jgi:hypothetical protein